MTHAAAFLCGVIVAGSMAADAVPTQSRSRDRYRTLDAFAEALSYISNQYVDPMDERKLVYGAVRGMVDQLDQHSTFLPPQRYERLRQDTEGEFAGVGLTLGAGPQDDSPPIIDGVIAGSPASRAGLRVNDRVLEVDGKATIKEGRPMNPQSLHSKVRGRAGTRLRLSIERDGWAVPRPFELVREQVKVPTVEWFYLDQGIGYIGVSKFQEATAADVRSALVAIEARSPGKQIRGVLFDLRGNPGGLLDQAIRTADLFIDEGAIVTVGGRKGTAVEREIARPAGTFRGFPMITLVDQGSASAAEIVAGALQDHKRATILGLPSYGKGSVQTFLDLKDGSGLKLTTARYYTPSGKSLEGVGIKPDVEVEAFEGDDIVAGDSEGDSTEEAPDAAARTTKNDARTRAKRAQEAKMRERIEDDHQLRIAYQMLRTQLGSKN
jgi:carboxyl-terminal processing protease